MPEGTEPDPTDRGTQHPNAAPLREKGNEFILFDCPDFEFEITLPMDTAPNESNRVKLTMVRIRTNRIIIYKIRLVYESNSTRRYSIRLVFCTREIKRDYSKPITVSVAD